MKKMMGVLLLVFMVGCADSDLQKVAKASLVLSKTVGVLQTDVIAANQAGMVDDNVTGQILQVCTRVSVAGKQADSIVRGLATLDPQSRSNLISLLTPIGQALDPSQLEFVAGIKDPATKQKVEGSLILLRSTLSGLQLVLAVQGGA